MAISLWFIFQIGRSHHCPLEAGYFYQAGYLFFYFSYTGTLCIIVDVYTSDNATRCQATTLDANEVLRQYAAGERNFRQADWRGISLAKANLIGIDLTGAHLNNADLSNSDLSGANFNWAGLKGANFSGANLRGAKMPNGRTHNDRLESANYFG